MNDFCMLRSFAVVLVLVGALLGAGCTTTRSLSVSRPSASESGLHPYDETLTGERATIELVDGTARQGDIRRVQVDSLFWVDRATGTENALPLTEVQAIEVRRRLRGAWQGLQLGSGLGAGLLVGTTAAGMIREGTAYSVDNILPPWYGYFTAGLAAAAITAYGGAVIGFIRGATVRYEVAPSEGTPR